MESWSYSAHIDCLQTECGSRSNRCWGCDRLIFPNYAEHFVSDVCISSVPTPLYVPPVPLGISEMNVGGLCYGGACYLGGLINDAQASLGLLGPLKLRRPEPLCSELCGCDKGGFPCRECWMPQHYIGFVLFLNGSTWGGNVIRGSVSGVGANCTLMGEFTIVRTPSSRSGDYGPAVEEFVGRL